MGEANRIFIKGARGSGEDCAGVESTMIRRRLNRGKKYNWGISSLNRKKKIFARGLVTEEGEWRDTQWGVPQIVLEARSS